jgi:hypothetical protein
MARTTVFVWHDLAGQILAVGRPMSGSPCIPIPADGASAVQGEVDEEAVAGLHETHLVDVGRQALVMRGAATAQ